MQRKKGAEALAHTQLQKKRGNSTSESEFHRKPKTLEALLMCLLLSQSPSITMFLHYGSTKTPFVG